MSSLNKPVRLQSWIPPSCAWTTATDVFCVEVMISDPYIVEFISTGAREVTLKGTKKTARVCARMLGEKTLVGQFEKAVWVAAQLRPAGPRVKAGTKLVAHCHGVFLLPGEKSLCVVVGRAKPSSQDTWISTALKAKADTLLRDHQSKVAGFDEEMERKKQENEEFYDRYAADIKQKFKDVAVKYDQRPVLTAVGLLPLLPRGATFAVPPSGRPEKIARSAVAAIADSTFPPSRDGTYVGILPTPAGRRARGIVSWVPHDGLPSYPEVRWAVQRRLPAALHKPRSLKPHRPKFDSGTQPVDDSVVVHGFDPRSADVHEALADLQLDQSDFRNRVDDVRRDMKNQGYEAIAWFQPYHVWTEETWGIYFDAQKLDDFAYSFLDEFRLQSVRSSHGLAAFLAFGLTYAHELFHARVEAALSWLEINALQPKHRRYKQRVYDSLRETPDWLEEALANWSAWDWFKSDAVQAVMVRGTTNSEGVERVVASSLDLSPPGYQEWRLGQEPSTWSAFATQLSTGNPKLTSLGLGLPLKSILTGPLPYDLQPSDIPLRFVGEGVIADRLQSHPAMFNVPSRRELEKALKYFKHILDASGGKGGHQKWTAPDQRAFILPTRDPVSTGVFKTFLHHLGIDKATYVRQVRPNL